MTDTVTSLEAESTSPPDLLGSMGAARRRLDDLTRETTAESLAATTEGDARSVNDAPLPQDHLGRR